MPSDATTFIWVGTTWGMDTLQAWLPADLFAHLEATGQFEYAGLTFQRFMRFNRHPGLGVAVESEDWDEGANSLYWWELTGIVAETRQIVGEAFESWGVNDWDVRFHSDHRQVD